MSTNNIAFNGEISKINPLLSWEVRWPSGTASDSGARDREFDPH